MSSHLSRTKIAHYVAEQLRAGKRDVVAELAAFLVEERRTGEADLIMRSTLEQLEAEGIVLADVTSATAIDEAIKTELQKLTGAKQLTLREHVDESVLGGIRLETPSQRIDATFAHRLSQLRERKI